jgi:hypothetical protein
LHHPIGHLKALNTPRQLRPLARTDVGRRVRECLQGRPLSKDDNVDDITQTPFAWAKTNPIASLGFPNLFASNFLQAQEQFGKIKNGTEEIGTQVIEASRINFDAACDFVTKALAVKSPSELFELSTAHLNKQFEAVTQQSKELTALVQKVCTETTQVFSKSPA